MTFDKELINQSDRLDYAFNYTRENFLPIKGENSRVAYSHLELSQSSFSAYRNGSEPSALVLRRLAKPCGFSVHWLVTGEGSIFIDDIEHLGRVAHLGDANEKVIIGKDILTSVDTDIANLRFDTVLTNDMPNTVNVGDIILIDTLTTAKEGLLLVEHNNQRLLRRVQMRSDSEILLITETNGNEVVAKDSVKTLGKVVWRAGKL